MLSIIKYASVPISRVSDKIIYYIYILYILYVCVNIMIEDLTRFFFSLFNDYITYFKNSKFNKKKIGIYFLSAKCRCGFFYHLPRYTCWYMQGLKNALKQRTNDRCAKLFIKSNSDSLYSPAIDNPIKKKNYKKELACVLILVPWDKFPSIEAKVCRTSGPTPFFLLFVSI